MSEERGYYVLKETPTSYQAWAYASGREDAAAVACQMTETSDGVFIVVSAEKVDEYLTRNRVRPGS